MRTQLLALLKPFASRLVSPPAQGKHGDYVSHYVIEQRLLSAVGPYSWEITQTVRDADGTLTGCVGKLTVIVDGREVSCCGAGDVENVQNQKTNGERLKLAESDSFKRAAMRLGVGLHLWAQKDFYIYDALSKLSDSGNTSSPARESDDPAVSDGVGVSAAPASIPTDPSRVDPVQ